MTARFLVALLLFPVLLSAAREDQQPKKPSASQAQPPRRAPRPKTAMSVEESVALTNGWARLAEGQFDIAADTARSVLAKHPHSLAALSLAVDATIGSAGATAALGRYEAWL